MKKLLHYSKVFFLGTFFIFYSCDNDDIDDREATNPEIEGGASNASFGAVFFAQTHVEQPETDDFKLTSGKAALLKVNMNEDSGETAPVVRVTLTLGGTTETITLDGPATLSDPIDLELGVTQHTFDNSFTAVIPKEFIQPGLRVAIQAGDIIDNFDNLNIGAPNRMIMNMFDVHFFEFNAGDYDEGWQAELESKLPVSEIELRRLPSVIFSELTVPPRADVGAAATRVSSTEEYQALTGVSFDGEQAAAAQWNRALKSAAGIRGRYALFYTNIYGVPSGGQAGGFAGVGNGRSLGIFNHELGHALSLPHWGETTVYPYRGDLFGIPAPDSFNDVHVGPVWAFDLATNTFIPPTIQANSTGGVVGTYKKDPMQGGGTGDQEEGFLLRHFSDYSVNQMQEYMEGHIVVSNRNDGSYASWDSDTGSYSNILTNNGVEYAIENNIEVISVMAGVSAVTPQATILYPPIGPYTSGIINLFDPTNESDRASAASIYCPDGGCDVSLRIIQGGDVKIVMLPIALDTSLDPLDSDTFKTRAVNLLASDGDVTAVTLLSTPDAEIMGVPNSPEILYTWNN